MAKDSALLLDSADTIIANADTTAVNTEGGQFCIVSRIMAAMSGGGTTCDITVQCSINGGSNYYSIGKFQQLGPSDDNKIDSIVVYVPRYRSYTLYNWAAATPVKVRLHSVVAGGAPSYALTYCWLIPLVGVSAPAIDEANATGLAALFAAT